MPFNSLSYFIFLPIVWLVFVLTTDRWRWIVLLSSSMIFYAALNVNYLIGILSFVAVWNFIFGLKLRDFTAEPNRKAIFWVGLSGNILLLSTVKFIPIISNWEILLISIGVSYFVFQAISYLIDIYLEKLEPEPHFGIFFLSLAFFPKLLQGPIERSGDLLPQLKAKYIFNYEIMRSGLLLVAFGLFKKIVIADRLALFVSPVYSNISSFNGLSLLFATYAYAMQIYFDFSGYTDMAIGSALFFNVHLTKNFNQPYLATSVSDFWHRWHISFSKWILDYIFRPLQMTWRYKGTLGTSLALLITFILSGLWHGVGFGFLVWGGLHGLYMATSLYTRSYTSKFYKRFGFQNTWYLKIINIFVTFHLVAFAWIFFRAESLNDAYLIIVGISQSFDQLNLASIREGLATGQNIANIKALKLAFIIYLFTILAKKWICLHDLPIWIRWCCYAIFIMLTVVLSASVHYQFAYYQF